MKTGTHKVTTFQRVMSIIMSVSMALSMWPQAAIAEALDEISEIQSGGVPILVPFPKDRKTSRA